MSVAALVVELTLATEPPHAFATWTQRCATWWPASHTVSGDPAAIVFEPRAGGRIFERAADGVEHEWGEILAWEPPARLRYRWHLFFTPDEATEVDVTFSPTPDGTTALRLVQTGWERLGEAGPPRRERTHGAWAAITARLRESLTSPGAPPA